MISSRKSIAIENRDTYETEERATLIGRPFQFVEKLVF